MILVIQLKVVSCEEDLTCCFMQSQGPHRGVCLAEGRKDLPSESSCGYPQATGEALFSLGDPYHLEKEQSKWKMSSAPQLLITAQSTGLSMSMELLG